MSLTPDVTPVVKNYGTYETFMQHSPETEEHLQQFFPNTFREICTLSLIRLVDGVPAKLVRPVFSALH